MFQGLLNRAESAIDQVVAKYMSRAMVAVPLVVAGGFATAALTMKLIELYGSVTGYALMAALFAVIGLMTMAIVGVGAHSAPETAATEPSASATTDGSADDTMDAADLLTPEVRALLASAAPMAIPGIARGIVKNLPLILILAIIGFVISRFAETSEDISDSATGTGSTDTANTAPPSPAPSVAAAA